jgi:hypothetical protein
LSADQGTVTEVAARFGFFVTDAVGPAFSKALLRSAESSYSDVRGRANRGARVRRAGNSMVR